jgi:hypothetical protein
MSKPFIHPTLKVPKMENRKSALIIAPELLANQIHDWLTSFGLPSPQIDVITIPRDCVNILRSCSYKVIIAAQALDDVRGYRWYQALRTLGPGSQIVMFGQGEGGMPPMFAAEEVDKNLVYLSAGITQADVGEYASAWLPRADEPVSTQTIPALDGDHHQQCETIIKALREAVGSHAVYLVDNLGQTLASVGEEKASSMSEVGSLLGGSFAALFEVGKVLGYKDLAMNLIYRQGENEDLYALGVNTNFCIILLIARGPYEAKIGTVWYYTQKTALALKDILTSLNASVTSELFDTRVDIDQQFDDLMSPSWLDKNVAPSGPVSPQSPITIEQAMQEGLISEDFIDQNPNLYKSADTGDLFLEGS